MIPATTTQGLFAGLNPNPGSLFAPQAQKAVQPFMVSSPQRTVGGQSIFGVNPITTQPAPSLFQNPQPSLFQNALPASAPQPAQSLFNPIQPTPGQWGQPAQQMPQMARTDIFENPDAWRYKKIEALSEPSKAKFYEIQQEIDNNEIALKNAEHAISKLTDHQDVVNSKTEQLFSYSKKIVAKARRTERALEIRKQFEAQVSKFVREFIKVCEQCNSADPYHKIEAPAGFLSELLNNCEQRIKEMEDNIKEIEEIVKTETIPSQLSLLVHTISLMQDRFIVISGMANDMHKKVLELHNKVAGVMRDVYHSEMPQGLFTPKDQTEILEKKAEECIATDNWHHDKKIRDELEMTEEKDAPKPPVIRTPYSSVREAIVGRAGVLQGLLPRRYY
ncbi:unnamed protein product [Blepharisma stoltei]|uniref:Uncharacterized protein n=1 Tax=Blepharisma stoltei TaxID=1481888 RepID=A0AAU9J687_9CILI|nr:unnamed protein product [Blepharisma stoltei]